MTQVESNARVAKACVLFDKAHVLLFDKAYVLMTGD